MTVISTHRSAGRELLPVAIMMHSNYAKILKLALGRLPQKPHPVKYARFDGQARRGYVAARASHAAARAV